VVHRDLKPQNLLVRKDGRLAVVDFGSVRTALAPEGSSTVVGTFGYLAPEQLHGAAGPASDLYSLGVTMLALAAGMDGAQLPRKGLRIDAERVLAGFPDATLGRVWSALTEPDPDHRPQDVAAVRAMLAPAPAPPVPRPFATGSAQPPPLGTLPLWTPRGPVGRIFFFMLLLVMRFGIGVMGLVEDLVMPRVHARQRRQLERRMKADPLRRDVALAQLAHHHEVQRVKIHDARDRAEEWRRRMKHERRLLKPLHTPRLPRHRGP
jgi:serine/threonine protein kinase